MSRASTEWQRKVGVITLSMALFFMGAWVRSLTYMEIVDFAKGDYTTDILYSFDSAFVWRKVFQPSPDLATSIQEWESIPTTRYRYQFFTDERINWIWLWAGAGFGIQVESPNEFSYFFSIPHWFIVLPLTFVSACLLLFSKPRESSLSESLELMPRCPVNDNKRKRLNYRRT